MNSAGIVDKAIANLVRLNEIAKKNTKDINLSFEEDLLMHINSLKLYHKGQRKNLFKQNGKSQLLYYPCITEIFATIPGLTVGEFPKTKERDPVSCAQIQYRLCDNYPNKPFIKPVVQNAMECRAQCEDCFKLAFEEYYRWGLLKFKK